MIQTGATRTSSLIYLAKNFIIKGNVSEVTKVASTFGA